MFSPHYTSAICKFLKNHVFKCWCRCRDIFMSHVGVSALLGCWKCLKLHSPLLPHSSYSQGNSIGRSFQISCCSRSPDPFHGTFCEVCTNSVARQPNSPVGPPLNQLRVQKRSDRPLFFLNQLDPIHSILLQSVSLMTNDGLKVRSMSSTRRTRR